jgi:hypothetical protein
LARRVGFMTKTRQSSMVLAQRASAAKARGFQLTPGSMAQIWRPVVGRCAAVGYSGSCHPLPCRRLMLGSRSDIGSGDRS